MIFVIFVIILCANYFFYLIPYYHIPGKFNVWDVGNALIMISILIQLLRKRDLKILNNSFSWLIFVYLIIIGVQIGFINIVWGQSLIDSFIAIRHQLYYLSFFLFLLTIDTPEKVEKFMKILSVIAIIVIFISIINYFKPGIFHYKWTYGHGIRVGIKRAFIPGMDIICLLFFWYLSRYVFFLEFRYLFWSIFYYFTIIFRQTRSRILAVTLVLMSFLLHQRKFKQVLVISLFFAITIGIFSILVGSDIFWQNVQSAIEDIIHGQGTWAPRVEQMRVSWELFKKYPWTGAAAFLRIVEGVPREKVEMIIASTDIGYMAWLKCYGIPGIIWLLSLIGVFYWKNFKLLKVLPPKYLSYVYFNILYFSFVIISFLTLNHFMKPYGIILVCFVLSNTVVLSSIKKERQ